MRAATRCEPEEETLTLPVPVIEVLAMRWALLEQPGPVLDDGKVAPPSGYENFFKARAKREFREAREIRDRELAGLGNGR